MLLRPAATRWLARARNWTAVVAANSMIMTIFLWHLTALLVAVLALYPLGFPQPEGGTATWWALRPLWVACLAVVLAGFVAVFARFERPGLRTAAPPGIASVTPAIMGIALLVASLAGFAQSGFAFGSLSPGTALTYPLVNCGLALLGYRLIAGRTRTTA
jgi:hypothetical protein